MSMGATQRLYRVSRAGFFLSIAADVLAFFSRPDGPAPFVDLGLLDSYFLLSVIFFSPGGEA